METPREDALRENLDAKPRPNGVESEAITQKPPQIYEIIYPASKRSNAACRAPALDLFISLVAIPVEVGSFARDRHVRVRYASPVTQKCIVSEYMVVLSAYPPRNPREMLPRSRLDFPLPDPRARAENYSENVSVNMVDVEDSAGSKKAAKPSQKSSKSIEGTIPDRLRSRSFARAS